jgi:hypothetical protein
LVVRFLPPEECAISFSTPSGTRPVVFPLSDYVLGTTVRANETDLKYMEQWGL